MAKTDNTRRHPGKPGVRPDRYDEKRLQADDQKKAWEGLSVEKKLAELDARKANGMGEQKRQRARLAKTPKV
jgi:hypothetical protein